MKNLILLGFFVLIFNGIIAQNFNDVNEEITKKSFTSNDITQNDEKGTAVFIELLGKGYISANIDFILEKNHRISLGLTILDYDIPEDEVIERMTPGAMYYYLSGRGPSYFELGAGLSIYPNFKKDYYEDDSPLSLHGTIGYRYQRKNGLLFRSGFTPFYRINNWFLPLIGLSFGYCW